MLTFLRRLFFDETVFLRTSRACVMVLGGLAQAGQLDGLPPWAGALLMGLAIFVGAGDRNLPTTGVDR